MPTAHDLLVIAHHDLRERLVCPVCNTPFIGELGVAYLSEYRKESDDWNRGYLIYCGWTCVLQANPTLGSA